MGYVVGKQTHNYRTNEQMTYPNVKADVFL